MNDARSDRICFTLPVLYCYGLSHFGLMNKEIF